MAEAGGMLIVCVIGTSNVKVSTEIVLKTVTTEKPEGGTGIVLTKVSVKVWRTMYLETDTETSTETPGVTIGAGVAVGVDNSCILGTPAKLVLGMGFAAETKDDVDTAAATLERRFAIDDADAAGAWRLGMPLEPRTAAALERGSRGKAEVGMEPAAEAELKLRPALALTERPALEMGLRGSAEVGMDPVAEASSKLRPALTLTESPALRERPAKLEAGEEIEAGRGRVTEGTDSDGIEMGFKPGAEGLEIELDARPEAIGATVKRDGTGTASVKVNGIKVVRLDMAGTEPDACPGASGAMTVSRVETETLSVTGNGIKVGRLDGTEAETEAETDACAEASGLTMVSRVETEPVPVTGNGIMVARVDRSGPDNVGAPRLDILVADKAGKSKLGVAADGSVEKNGEAATEIDWLSSGFPDEVGKDRPGDTNIDGIDGNAVDEADAGELIGARFIEADAEIDSAWLNNGCPDEMGKAGADDADIDAIGGNEADTADAAKPPGADIDGIGGNEVDKAGAGELTGPRFIEADAEIETIGPADGIPEIGNARLDDGNIDGIGGNWLDGVPKARAEDGNTVGIGTEADKADAAETPGDRLIEADAAIEIIWPGDDVPEIGKGRADDGMDAICKEVDKADVAKPPGADIDGIGGNEADKADAAKPPGATLIDADAEIEIWPDNGGSETRADDANVNEASEAEVGIIWSDNGVPEIGKTRAGDDKLNDAGDPRLENVAPDNGVSDRIEPGNDGKIELGNAEEVKVGRPGPDSVGFNEDTPTDIDPNGREADSFTSSEADTTWPDDAKSIEAGKAEVGITWLNDGVPEIGKASADDAKVNEAGDPRLDSVAAGNAVPDRIEPGNDGKSELGNGEDDKAGRPGPDSVGVDKDSPDDTVPNGKDADAFTSSDADKIWPDNAEPVKAGETGPDSVGVDEDAPDTISPNGKDADALTSTEADKICPDDAEPVKAGKFGPDSDGADDDNPGNSGPADKDADAFTSTEADKIWPDDAELVEAGETGPDDTDSVETGFDGVSPDTTEPSEADGVGRDRGSPMEAVSDTIALTLGTDAESTCSDVGDSADGEAPDNRVVKPDRVPGSCRVEEPTPGNCRPDDAGGDKLVAKLKARPDEAGADEASADATGDGLVVKPESRPDNVGLGEASPDNNFAPDDTAPPDVDEACNVDALDDANPEVTELADEGPNEMEADNSSPRPGVSA